MSDGCLGCFSTQLSIQERLQTKVNEAKKYAVENQKDVYIFLTETNEWDFMEEEAAIKLGINPTGGVVSRLQPATPIFIY